jgi:uncharacterized membrane protein YdfJ with MMPL/SSD domain
MFVFLLPGVGLATAILIDATVVRGVLLPAALALLDDRAWYLARWLAWLPGGGAGGREPAAGTGTERSLPQREAPAL